MSNFKISEKCIYYCQECNILYNSCYELENIFMCEKCWSYIKVLNETEIIPFIRNKRLKKLNDISKNS